MQLDDHKVIYLHNLQTIDNGCYITITVNCYRQQVRSMKSPWLNFENQITLNATTEGTINEIPLVKF